MRSLICAALLAASFAPTAVIAQQVDPGFSVPEVDPEFGVAPPNGSGAHPLAAILFFPIYAAARVQASLQPEKASCWNEGASEVALCNVAERYDSAVEKIQSRPKPTPYGF